MRRDGLTLFEVITGIAIAAILAVAIYASFGNDTFRSTANSSAVRSSQAASALFEIASAIASMETTNTAASFEQTVGAYPHALSQLTTPITNTDRNSCNRVTDVYSGAAVTAWKGPYVLTPFVPGAQTQIVSGYTVQDALVRVPANPPANPKNPELAARLQIHMASVTQADAQALDALVDQTISGTIGTVRYAATDPTALDYELRISGC
ncbi:MAG TPA: prepilin-type N-terminal cleavage/methylation domain-containing protein [Gemmatimonadaceae bacterium]|nr:prepilin-type N-terminal cleavage/methylation domain-containing protein [Gemmatimonadaceae bacterium]